MFPYQQESVMKLSEDATARARLRMLRVWLTVDQYRDVCSNLKEVEAAPRPRPRRRAAADIAAAGKAVIASIRSMWRMIERLGAR